MNEHYHAVANEQAPQEIERKFLVSRWPENVEGYKHEAIRQGYLVIGDDGSEARVRDRDGIYTLTVKTKGALARGEWEAPITAEQFETWWPASVGRRVEKVRYSIPHEEYVIELDMYEGALRGLATAEVEFQDMSSAYAFNPPAWLGEDVTADSSYKNQNLATQGRPYDFTG